MGMTEENEDSDDPRETPPSRLRIGKLKTLGDIARECGRLYRRAARGLVSSADASRQASILAVMRQCLESSDTEKRVEELEHALKSPVRRVA